MSVKTLLSLPNNVLNEVAKGLDYKEILHLREVCTTLKNFVDVEQPDFNMRYIQIAAIFDGVYEAIVCNFGVDVNDLTRSTYMKSVILDDRDPYKWNVLNTVLGHQKSTLEILSLVRRFEPDEPYYAELLDHLKESLLTRVSKIQTKHFRMNATSQHQVMQILPLVDPNQLKQIALTKSLQNDHSIANPLLEMNEIRALEQWKKAESLYSSCKLNNATVDDITHFQIINIVVPVLSVSNLFELKEIFLRSAPSRDFQIRFDRLNVDVPIGALGQPEGSSSVKNYFFPIPNSEDHVLSLDLHDNSVHIKYISKEQQAEKRRKMEEDRRMSKIGPLRNGRIFHPNLLPAVQRSYPVIPRRALVPRQIVKPIDVITLD